MYVIYISYIYTSWCWNHPQLILFCRNAPWAFWQPPSSQWPTWQRPFTWRETNGGVGRTLGAGYIVEVYGIWWGVHWISLISQPYNRLNLGQNQFSWGRRVPLSWDLKMGDFTTQRHRREVFCALGCTVRYPTWWGAWMMNIPLLGAS